MCACSSSLCTRVDTCAMTCPLDHWLFFGGSCQQALFLTLRVLNTCSKLFSTILLVLRMNIMFALWTLMHKPLSQIVVQFQTMILQTSSNYTLFTGKTRGSPQGPIDHRWTLSLNSEYTLCTHLRSKRTAVEISCEEISSKLLLRPASPFPKSSLKFIKTDWKLVPWWCFMVFLCCFFHDSMIFIWFSMWFI